jgi:hypothetical protein
MRWGWIALAVFSAAFYIAQSGIVQAVMNLDNRDGEDEEIDMDEDDD